MAPSSLGTFLTNLDRNQSLALFLMASDTGRRNMGSKMERRGGEPEAKPEEPEENRRNRRTNRRNRRKTGGKPEENRRKTGGKPEGEPEGVTGSHFKTKECPEAPVPANSRNRTVLELKLNRFETKQAERLHFRAKCSL